jgi:hypothetical protein
VLPFTIPLKDAVKLVGAPTIKLPAGEFEGGPAPWKFHEIDEAPAGATKAMFEGAQACTLPLLAVIVCERNIFGRHKLHKKMYSVARDLYISRKKLILTIQI